MGESRRPTGAMLRARPHLAAGLLFGLLVLGYLWPVLVGGKILSPIADLYPYAPWKGYTPSDVQDYVNPTLFDLPVVDYPWRFLVRQLIREGTFPAWDPYVLGGIPLYSNPQTGLFSPFNLPLWILPLTYGLGVSAALKLLAGAFGTYLLVRQLRLGFLPGLLAGVSFGFAAVNITWLAHETLPGVVVTLPWAVWLVERLFERRRVGDAIGLAVVIAIGLGGGHPGMQVHLLVVTSVYVLVRAVCTSGLRLRPLLLIAGGLAAGALLMAFMLIPEARSSHDTVGVLARRAARLPGSRLPFASLKTVVFPDWWGRPSAVQAPADASNIRLLNANFCERTFYAGTVALLLACIGLLSPGAWRRKGPFLVIGLLGLAVALRAPGLYWIVTHLPVLENVEAQRLHLAFEFAVAVLAGFGLQALLDAPAAGRRRVAVPLVAVLGGLFALATAHAQPGDVGHTVAHFVKGTDYASKAVLAMTSVVWFLLFALAVGALLLLVRIRPHWRTGVAVALLALVVLDARHFVDGFQPMGPPSKVIPPMTPALAYLQRHRADGRIVGLDEALPNDWSLVYGIRDVRGYDPPQPTQRMLALWRVASPGHPGWAPLSLHGLERRQLHVLGVLGGRYVVAEPGFRLPPAAPATLTIAYAGADATIVANAAVTPRVLVPANVRVTASGRATRAAIAEPGFDPRTTVAIERDQPGAAALTGDAEAAHGSATIVAERNAGVTLRAQLDRRGLVVLDDDLIEGWRVRVDGRPVPALHVDGVMRGAIVPAGRHEVVWSYTVPGLRLGAFVSLVAFAALAGGGIVLAVRARRRRAGELRA